MRGNYCQFNLHLFAAGIAIRCHRYLIKNCPKRPKLSLRAIKGFFHVKIQLTAYCSRLWLVLYRLLLFRVWQCLNKVLMDWQRNHSEYESYVFCASSPSAMTLACKSEIIWMTSHGVRLFERMDFGSATEGRRFRIVGTVVATCPMELWA